MMEYAVVVMKLSDADGGGYLALVPDLYGCMSDGDTPEEAVRNAQDAIADWIEVSTDLGRKIPSPGTSATRFKARETALIATIKILSENFDGIDARMARLEGEIEHVRELIENQEYWSRFDVTVSLDQKVAGKLALPC